jgi:uncharacterized membrane protein
MSGKTKKTVKTVKCGICGKKISLEEAIPAPSIRRNIRELIIKEHPDWDDDHYLCKEDNDRFRLEYITNLLRDEKGKVEELESEVIESIKASEPLSDNIDARYEKELTFGARIADAVADFGGSWTFIIIFFIILALWIIINSIHLMARPMDPYPYILLNLILSCLAAIQAPIIMMSQNRQEAKDRLRSTNDYKINLKSEIEIKTLHEKIDHLLGHQWEKMADIQDLQIEMLEEISNNLKELQKQTAKK